MNRKTLILFVMMGCAGNDGDTGVTALECESTSGTLSVHAVNSWGGERGGDYDLQVTPIGEETFTVAASAPNFSIDLATGDYTLDVYETPDSCFALETYEVNITACEISEVEIEFECWGR